MRNKKIAMQKNDVIQKLHKKRLKPAWNKGLTKETDIRIKQYSEKSSKTQKNKSKKKKQQTIFKFK